MLNVRLADDYLMMFDGVLCAVFFPLDVLDEIWDLTESVSEGFVPTLPLELSSVFFIKSRY